MDIGDPIVITWQFLKAEAKARGVTIEDLEADLLEDPSFILVGKPKGGTSK